ncbi:Spc7-domain-containing protein [Aulographum hederae CBS 113979]|uniref:Spc7-domain-containing protein n=1 Tax=Aulographum hederae CBS 113979 TaxID=1176131 RepID=A0A6G1HB86_9PEZI|nr:Spc7-domain-containing protein [Aulographum hederae CBS 113979]
MSTEMDKENIADGMLDSSPKSSASSPRKSSLRSRSKSIGPGGLTVPLREESGNRRKSSVVPQSILPSKEDEQKRREARRKSLANRRVSFAPEATLHTWDVVEYLRDATTSSASSEPTRRASSVASAKSPQSNTSSPAAGLGDAEPPSTPPEQVEEPQPSTSPAHQRDLHQKQRRRRSSGIPPMNFNNPEDEFSSSPYSGSSPVSEGVEASPDSDDEDTAMSMDMDMDLGEEENQTGGSVGTDNTECSSSARLDEALRQAAAQAGSTRHGFDDDDEDGEQSMQLADDEVTASFKPFSKRTSNDEAPIQIIPSLRDQENVNPFVAPANQSPAYHPSKVLDEVADAGEDDDDSDDGMSMDITRAVGGIIKPSTAQSPGDEGATMDFTVAVGGIQKLAPLEPQINRRASLKRRRSSANLTVTGDAQGSPAKKLASRRSSIRRRSSAEDSSVDDETMDFTMPLGGIQPPSLPVNQDRRASADSSFGEAMDFTMVVGGGIKHLASNDEVDDGESTNADMSMEVTEVLGSILDSQQPKAQSMKTPSPTKTRPPSRRSSRTPTNQATFASPTKSSARKTQPPVSQVQSTPQKSPQKQTRKSLNVATPENKNSEPEVIPATVEKAIPSTPKSTAKSPILNSGHDISPKSPVRYQDMENHPRPAPPSPSPRKPLSTLGAIILDELTPQKSSGPKRGVNLATSIKSMSTPRKQAQATPIKRGPTPKKSPAPKPEYRGKALTPRKALTSKKVAQIISPVKETEKETKLAPVEAEVEGERIQLQDFLGMTGIKFMDLTTTKRRHTGFPGANILAAIDDENHDKEDGAPSFESGVVAAACTVPMLSMYQHSCHELKSHIAEGREDVQTIEAEVYENQPPLFREYLSAPPSEKHIMDNQFKNMKANARLQSKASWYGWRSDLLNDLKKGLDLTTEGFNQDEQVLEQQEQILNATLPDLKTRHGELEIECKQLQDRADEINSCDRAELEDARERLVAADAEIEEKTQLIDSLRKELEDKVASIEAIKERKNECVEEIKVAERVRQECRGWSVEEVTILKENLNTLEQTHGWSIHSASTSPPTLTLTHASTLRLFLHPSSFILPNSAPPAQDAPNTPISLTYIGDTLPKPKPLTTTLRFFLQHLRAHLQCLPQSRTRISDVLTLIKDVWATAEAVQEGVRLLDMGFVTNTAIRSDERMAVEAGMLVPGVATKVRVAFEIGVGVLGGGGEGGMQVETNVKIAAEVVYGERYDEGKMGEFITACVGTGVGEMEQMGRWRDAVEELRARLVRRGRKAGGRRV